MVLRREFLKIISYIYTHIFTYILYIYMHKYVCAYYIKTMSHLLLWYIFQIFHRKLMSGSQKVISHLSGGGKVLLLKDKKPNCFTSMIQRGFICSLSLSVPTCVIHRKQHFLVSDGTCHSAKTDGRKCLRSQPISTSFSDLSCHPTTFHFSH